MDSQDARSALPASKKAVAYRHIPSFRFATPPRREAPPQRSVAAEEQGTDQASAAALDDGTLHASACLSMSTDAAEEAASASTASHEPQLQQFADSFYGSRGGSVGIAFRDGHKIMPSPKMLSRRRAPDGDKAMDDTLTSTCSAASPLPESLGQASFVDGRPAAGSTFSQGRESLGEGSAGTGSRAPASDVAARGSAASTSSGSSANQASSLEVPTEIAHLLAQAYDEDPRRQTEPSGASGFRWSGMVDAAHAAWIGGTQLLRYGEILPGGAAKAMAWLLADGELATAGGASSSEEPSASLAADNREGCSKQLVLELGMGRGRLALQLFLCGATVIGVELASERYGLAVSALERLAHRFPEDFEISKRTAEVLRIRRRGGPKGAICEIRLGSFFDVVSADEIGAATMIFFQVCLPPPTWPKVRHLFSSSSPGCRVLSFEDLKRIWSGEGGVPLEVVPAKPFPFTELGSPFVACTWAPAAGHRFHCYKGVQEVVQVDSQQTSSATAQLQNLAAKEDISTAKAPGALGPAQLPTS